MHALSANASDIITMHCHLMLSPQVSQDWNRIKLPELLGRDNLFVGMHDAFQHAQVCRGLPAQDQLRAPGKESPAS